MLRVIAVLLSVILAIPLGLGAAWKWSVSFREKVLLAGLASGIDPVQRASAEELRNYPSKTTALALVAFVNLKYRPPEETRTLKQLARVLERATDSEAEKATESDLTRAGEALTSVECVPDGWDPAELRSTSGQERKALAACVSERVEILAEQRKRGNKVAERGFRSLCILTGHAFGTHYEKRSKSISWGSLSDERWSQSLGQLNAWAFQIFGGDTLVGLLGGLEAPAPAVPSAGEPEFKVSIRVDLQPSGADENLMDWSQYGFEGDGQ